MCDSPSLKHSEDIVGLFRGLISILLCFQELGEPREGRGTGVQPIDGAVRTHTMFIHGACDFI